MYRSSRVIAVPKPFLTLLLPDSSLQTMALEKRPMTVKAPTRFSIVVALLSCSTWTQSGSTGVTRCCRGPTKCMLSSPCFRHRKCGIRADEDHYNVTYSIGMDYGANADCFLVFIGSSTNASQPKLLVLNETITSDARANSTQTNDTHASFKSSGLKMRTVDMSPYMDQKISMEFVVADKNDQAIDVSIPLRLVNASFHHCSRLARSPSVLSDCLRS